MHESAAAALAKARQEAKEKGITFAKRNPLEKLQDNPTSRKLAIDAMCYTCVGAGADSGVRAAIRNCGVRKCPLYACRPYKAEDTANADDEE